MFGPPKTPEFKSDGSWSSTLVYPGRGSDVQAIRKAGDNYLWGDKTLTRYQWETLKGIAEAMTSEVVLSLEKDESGFPLHELYPLGFGVAVSELKALVAEIEAE